MYMVIGHFTVDATNGAAVAMLESLARRKLLDEPTQVPMITGDLSLVGYLQQSLPKSSTSCWSLSDIDLTVL